MEVEVLIKQAADGVIWPEREARAWIQCSELNSQAILIAQETLDDRIIDRSIVNLLRSVLLLRFELCLLRGLLLLHNPHPSVDLGRSCGFLGLGESPRHNARKQRNNNDL